MSVSDNIKSAGTIVVTALVFMLVLIWSIAVWKNLGKPPTYLSDGKTVEVDEFARAKDMFILVLPLLTTAVGYWLGSQGAAKSAQQADAAETAKSLAEAATKEATSRADRAEATLAHVRETHPQAFSSN